MNLQSINPATGEVLESYQETTPNAVQGIVAKTHEAFLSWRETKLAARAERMRRAAETLRRGASEYARLMAREMGKPVRDGLAEAQKCALVCDYFADHARRFLVRQLVATEARTSFVTFQPFGVVLAVMPWNFPFWQVFRFAAPALMAGNGAVLKHASNVPGCALAIEEICKTGGLPTGLFRSVLVPGAKVEPLIADPRIQAVTLTGSSDVGERVAGAGGRNLKKQVLELGGSDPFI